MRVHLPGQGGRETRSPCSAPTAPRSSCAPTSVPPEHPDSYYSVARRLARETENGWQPDQYANPDNPAAHYHWTGPEIWRQTDGQVTHFVAGIGTGGTISGTGRYLKEASEGRVKIIGADPEGSVYSGGSGRPYLVEGVGEDIWPATFDRNIADEVIAISDADSFAMTAAARPGGGPARRRLVRPRRGGGAARRGHGGARRRHRRHPARRRPRLPVEDLQRRLDGRLRVPARRSRRADRRRPPRRQGDRPARARPRPPGRDRRAGDRAAARVRRLAAARGPGRSRR